MPNRLQTFLFLFVVIVLVSFYTIVDAKDLNKRTFANQPSLNQTPMPQPEIDFTFSGQIAYIDLYGVLWLIRGDTGQRQRLSAEEPTLDPNTDRIIGFSPTGEHLAICAYNPFEENWRVYLRTLPENQLLSPDNLPCSIAWSPDGQQLVYSKGESIYIYDISSEQHTEIVDSINDLDFIASEFGLGQPTWSPNGRWISFRAQQLEGSGSLWIYDTQIGDAFQWDEPVGVKLSWSPDGAYFIYDTITYVGVPGSQIRAGDPLTRKSRLLYSDPDLISQGPILSPTASWIAFTQAEMDLWPTKLVWMKADGSEAPRGHLGHNISPRAWSPDETKLIALHRGSSSKLTELVVVAIHTGEMDVISHESEDSAWGILPQGSPSATGSEPEGQIAYLGSDENVWVWRSDTGEQTQIEEAIGETYGIAGFSPDGNFLAYCQRASEGNEVRIYSIDPPAKVALFADHTRCENFAWSPDSRKILYVQEKLVDADSLERQFSLRDVDLYDRTWREWHNFVSVGQHRIGKPTWSPNGEWISYWKWDEGRGTLWFINTKTKEQFAWDNPSMSRISWLIKGDQFLFSEKGNGAPLDIKIGDLNSRTEQSRHASMVHYIRDISLSPDGTQVFYSQVGGDSHQDQFMSFDLSTSMNENLHSTGSFYTWASNGNHFLFDPESSSQDELWIYDIQSKKATLFQAGSHGAWGPLPTDRTTGVEMTHFEINQAIQDEDNSVLIANKPAVLRVYLNCGQNCNSGARITGRLYISNPLVEDFEIEPINSPMPEYTTTWQDHRGDLDKSLNFNIPAYLLLGDVTFSVQLDGGISRSETYSFEETWQPTILYVPIQFKSQTPSYEYKSASTYADNIFPTSKLWNHYITRPQIWRWPYDECEKDCAALLSDYLAAKYLVLGTQADIVIGVLPVKSLSNFGGGSPRLGNVQAAVIEAGNTSEAVKIAHELGHIWGLHHPHQEADRKDPNCVNPQIDNRNDYWPYQTSQLDDFGINVLKKELVPPVGINKPNYDFMSYCGDNRIINPTLEGDNKWISFVHYEKLFDEVFDLDSTYQIALNTVSAENKTVMSISGEIRSDGHVTLDPIWITKTNNLLENVHQEGDYCLISRSSDLSILQKSCFEASFADYETGRELQSAHFLQLLPYSEEATQVELVYNGDQITSVTSTNNQPMVELISPNGGEDWRAIDLATIAWHAEDLDGDPLNYTVYYTGDGNNWIPLEMGITTTQITVDPNDLPGGQNARIRVQASDGFLNSQDESDEPFINADKKPWTAIQAPSTQTVPAQSQVWLHGTGYDPEDGPIEDRNLHWSSSLDGDLGVGSYRLANLTTGHHTIQLCADDSQGQIGCSSIDLFIGVEAPSADDESPDLPTEVYPDASPQDQFFQLLDDYWPLGVLICGASIILLIIILLLQLKKKDQKVSVVSGRSSSQKILHPLIQQGIDHVRQGQISEAKRKLTQVLKEDSHNAEVWLWLGYAVLQEKEYKTAERCFNRAKILGDSRADKALIWLRNHISQL